MSALRKLLETVDINDMTCLQFAVFKLNQINQGQAEQAAEELAAKDADLLHKTLQIDCLEMDLEAANGRLARMREALSNLFQACSSLPLPEMDRMEKEINAASDVLKEE